MNSLKVFFDKVYETEVTRAIEKSDYSFEFNLDLGRKKNIKRYILNSEFLLEKVKESFNFNIEEKSENEDDYEMNIPASFLLKKYGNNMKLLIGDFKKYSENIKRLAIKDI
ncbi:hypothetical protein ACV3TA_15030 [Clostridium perfringens]